MKQEYAVITVLLIAVLLTLASMIAPAINPLATIMQALGGK